METFSCYVKTCFCSLCLLIKMKKHETICCFSWSLFLVKQVIPGKNISYVKEYIQTAKKYLFFRERPALVSYQISAACRQLQYFYQGHKLIALQVANMIFQTNSDINGNKTLVTLLSYNTDTRMVQVYFGNAIYFFYKRSENHS